MEGVGEIDSDFPAPKKWETGISKDIGERCFNDWS